MSGKLEQAINSAKLHNALPLLFHILGKEKIDDTLLPLYRKQYIQNYLSITFLLRELGAVLSSLTEEAIDVIMLKGAALSIDVYPSPGLRPMRDIDLLFHREDLARALSTLSMLGYKRYLPPARNGIEKFQGEITYVKQGDPHIVIEPHWTLGPEYPYSRRIDAAGLWHRAKRVNLAGIDTRVLCPEDTLLHLCLHLFQHCQSFWLIPACDITELTRHYQDSLDWDAFLNRVLEFELCLPVQYSLNITSELFHSRIPDFIFNELGLYNPNLLERRLFVLLANLNGPFGPGNLVKFLTIPGITQKLRYLYSIFFPSKEWLISYYSGYNYKRWRLYAQHMRKIFLRGPKVLFSFAFGKK